MDGIMNILQLLSVSVFIRGCESTYRLFPEAKPWSEAQSFCRGKCVDLLTVHDLTEMNVLLEMFQGQFDDALWFGLSRGTSRNYHWSLADERFYKEGERNYFNGVITETNNNCVYFRDNQLYTGFCARHKTAVCFDESKQGAGQYVLTETQIFWHNARDFCRATYTDLASVRNAAESQMISEVAAGQAVWVGLFRDYWAWSDSSTSSLRFLPVGTHPLSNSGLNCFAIANSESGRWVERDCSQALPFVCHCPKWSVTLQIALGSATGLDLNDPSAQQNIIQQMELLLNQDVRLNRSSLRWVKRSDGTVFKKKPVTHKKKNSCPMF